MLISSSAKMLKLRASVSMYYLSLLPLLSLLYSGVGAVENTYQLDTSFSGRSFFDGFDFFNVSSIKPQKYCRSLLSAGILRCRHKLTCNLGP
jgi:hypothetical protein